MTDQALIEEGEKLCKPCFLLTEQPQASGVVGFWGGSGRPDIPQEFPSFVKAFVERTHWLTIDNRWLSKLGFKLDGSLSLYEDERTEGGTVGTVFYEPKMDFTKLSMDGIPLYAKPSQSFPPLAAVCLYGGIEVESWLKSKGLERYDYSAIENEAYQKIWCKRSPMFSNDCAAMLGGWHVMWPEDDCYAPRELKLLIWTFKDSEPWIEVWMGTNFRVKLRST